VPARAQAQAQHLCISWCVSFLSCYWESAPLPTRRLWREGDDGLSDHEASEISSPMLLLRWRPGREEEPRFPIKSAIRCRHTQGLPTLAWPVVKTATPEGVAVAILLHLPCRDPCKKTIPSPLRMGHPAIPSVPKNDYSNHGNHEHGLVPTHP
jgi:hypothetical protein